MKTGHLFFSYHKALYKSKYRSNYLVGGLSVGFVKGHFHWWYDGPRQKDYFDLGIGVLLKKESKYESTYELGVSIKHANRATIATLGYGNDLIYKERIPLFIQFHGIFNLKATRKWVVSPRVYFGKRFFQENIINLGSNLKYTFGRRKKKRTIEFGLGLVSDFEEILPIINIGYQQKRLQLLTGWTFDTNYFGDFGFLNITLQYKIPRKSKRKKKRR